MRRRSASWAMWGWPIVLALASAVGLACGLWGDGGWDVLGWIGIGLPVAASLWFGLRRGTRGR